MLNPIPNDRKHTRVHAVWQWLHDAGDSTAADMADGMGVTQHAVTQAVNTYRRAHPGVFRIAKWHRYAHESTGRAGGGRAAPVWSVTPGNDRAPPRRVTASDSSKAYYRRNRALLLADHAVRRARKGQPPAAPVWLRGLL